MYFFTRFILSKALASRRQVQKKDDNIVHNKQTNKQGYFADDPV